MGEKGEKRLSSSKLAQSERCRKEEMGEKAEKCPNSPKLAQSERCRKEEMGEKGENRSNSPKPSIVGRKKWAKKPKNVQTRPKRASEEARNGRKG